MPGVVRRSLRGSFVLVLPVLLATCETTPSTGTISNEVCLIWRPLTYSARGDTPETVEQVRAHNARRQAYCEQ